MLGWVAQGSPPGSHRCPLTPLRLMASRRSPTTLFPSAPEALKPLVQLRRMPCGEREASWLLDIYVGGRVLGPQAYAPYFTAP